MGLRLNETKTGIRDARKESFDFLGYTFGPERVRWSGQWYLAAKPSKKSLRRVRQAIWCVLRPGNQRPRGEVVASLNRVIRGWRNYFCYGTRMMAYRAIDNYVCERLQHFFRRRHQVPTRGARRFNRRQLFEEWGVLRLWTLAEHRTACALR
jgi:RNA-directed DNA polymerase